MPKVSIIIPFNNVEGYIEECLNSVLTQTLEDIEIICINDASTDKTVDIVKSFEQKDERIKLIELDERKGQGYARNRGIEIASGDYIGFVDSDDFIKPEMFEKLYNAALQTNSEITMCQALEYDDVTGQYIDSDYYSLAPLQGFKDGVFSAEDTKNVILDINVALWNKIYKRSYLLNIGEKFPEGFIYEDLPFFFGTYLSAKRIKIVWESFYNYRINRKNSTMQQFNNKILDRPPMVSLTYEKMKKAHFLDDMQKVLQGWIINDLFHRYTLLKEHYQREFFFLMKKVFQNLEIENINDDYWKRVYHFEGYLLVVNNTFEDFSQRVFNEYLDIHKVEDRLRSQIIDYSELDRRFGLVYDDLGKVYKYCEQIVSESQEKVAEEIVTTADKKIEETKANIVQVQNDILEKVEETKTKLNSNIARKVEESASAQTVQTDEKISKVYEEISKNYEYTNKLNETAKNEITQAREEINKNYDYTNKLNSDLKQELHEKSKSLYSDIKDISFVVQDNFVELSKVQEEIKNECKKLQEEDNQRNLKTEEQLSNINEKIENQAVLANQMQDKTNSMFLNIKQEFELEKQNYLNAIENLKIEYKSMLQEKEVKHEQEKAELKNQIAELQNQIKEFKLEIREEMKSPIKKLIEKYKNKQEK